MYIPKYMMYSVKQLAVDTYTYIHTRTMSIVTTTKQYFSLLSAITLNKTKL